MGLRIVVVKLTFAPYAWAAKARRLALASFAIPSCDGMPALPAHFSSVSAAVAFRLGTAALVCLQESELAKEDSE